MIEFNKLIQAQFLKMCATGILFRSNITGQEVWDIYLSNFDKEHDPVFRDPESTAHNCNLCNNFMRRYGNIVAIDEKYQLMTLFDCYEQLSGEYRNSAEMLSQRLRNSKVENVFFETYQELNSLPYEVCKKDAIQFKLGIDKNVKRYTKEEAEKFGVVKPNEIRTFNHFHLFLPKAFVNQSGQSIEAIMANYRDAKNVFKRAMDEIPLDTLYLVRDLIKQGSLLDGTTHLHKVDNMIVAALAYEDIIPAKKDNWAWIKSHGNQFAKFRNELIGTLCAELAEGVELNKACQDWNKRVDPANYMKAVAPITKRQIEEAKKFVEENGYEDSFARRCATIEDIKASEILHLNAGDGAVKKVSIFDEVKATSTRHKRSEFDTVEEVHIDKFMKDILPACTSVEAYFENRMKGNLVTLTTSNIPDSKKIMKWSNNYSWTYNGNLAGKSLIKEAIKGRGGKTEGCLNIRLHFPNTISDYDLHVIEPGGYEIYYSNVRRPSPCGGMLDLDAQGVDGHQNPDNRVENVIYTVPHLMKKGKYQVFVRNYSQNDNNHGFTMEIETYTGDTVSFTHTQPIKRSQDIFVADIILDGEDFTISPRIPIGESNTITQEIYGLETNNFHKVNLVCLSPNHWDDNNIGNKHYFFMLEGAKSPSDIRGFHNENLISDLLNHRKVMDVLGNTAMIPSTDKQLSGLGFNATIKDEVILRLKGSHKRIIKVKF